MRLQKVPVPDSFIEAQSLPMAVKEKLYEFDKAEALYRRTLEDFGIPIPVQEQQRCEYCGRPIDAICEMQSHPQVTI